MGPARRPRAWRLVAWRLEVGGWSNLEGVRGQTGRIRVVNCDVIVTLRLVPQVGLHD